VKDAESVALIESFLRGERAAIFQLSRWVSIEIRSLGGGPLGRHREDLIQETLLRLWKVLGGGEFRGQSSLQRYVRAIARYVALDQIRKKPEREVTGEDAGATVVDEATPVDDRLAERERVVSALAELPQDDGRLLVEAYVEERPYAEMAAERGISHGTLKVRVFRAARRAREAWSRAGAGGALSERATDGES
jgi:RNA polymerase sigma-70 factor (ECF subfamily)